MDAMQECKGTLISVFLLHHRYLESFPSLESSLSLRMPSLSCTAHAGNSVTHSWILSSYNIYEEDIIPKDVYISCAYVYTFA